MIGGIAGLLVVSLINPIVNLFGFNKFTYLMLLYSLPLTGMFSIAFSELFSKRMSSKKEGELKASKTPDITGKTVVVHTNLGSVHKGKVRFLNEDTLALDNVTRLDAPSDITLDHLFLSKNEIRKIEVVD